MPKAIVAVGGGEIRTRGTASIDREIIRLTNKKYPRLLFIPTASSDSERYWKHVQEHFGGYLKCKTDVLLLMGERVSKQKIKRQIRWADIVYVGGGNTLQMMRVWRCLGVDKLLKSAYENGTVLSGISAGSICWFDSGHSDSMSFSNPRNWNYINVKGLGLIKGIHCPHYNSRTRGVPRRKDFRDMIRRTGGIGIAIENNCAIEFIDGRFYKVITSKDYARAYRVYEADGQVISERIKPGKHLAPIELLYRRSRECREAAENPNC
ncbi:MAG: peptidase E [Terriglobales bacterium]